ncbi:MAG: ribulokinase [Solibacillus sp.]
MYSIGLDYGTESCRAALLDLQTAQVVAVVERAYPNGVITEILNGVRLKKSLVLQQPLDYLTCMQSLIRQLLEERQLEKEAIQAIGIDFTSCTALPVDAQFNPLCTDPQFQQPQAHAKLWKSHSAFMEAEHITNVLANHPHLQKYGGIISSEWLLPKLLELKNDVPEVFEACTYFMEAGDWLASKLTNRLVRSSCQAGFKGLWQKEIGFLDAATLRKIDPAFVDIYETKLSGDVMAAGNLAGNLTEEMADFLGLHTNVAVAVPIIDAHSAVVGAGLSKSNEMLIVVGTSSCHMLLSNEERHIPGVAGVVEDGIFEGLYAYEAGQVAVGDIFSYFMREQLPAYYTVEAEEQGCSVFDVLNRAAQEMSVGAHGLVALDWHNGNRTPYTNPNVSAVFVGETLQTKPYEKYRALIESTAFGTKVIVELFQQNGVAVDRILLSGGIPRKNAFLVQIYADVLQKPLIVLEETQIPALGAAILGAAAFEEIPLQNAAQKYGATKQVTFKPNAETKDVYEQLYASYKSLMELFHQHPIMNRLHELKMGGQGNG